MLSRIRHASTSSRTGLIAGCLALLCVASFAGAKKNSTTRKLTFDPTAPQVELFEGIEDGDVTVKMIAKDSTQANLFFQNTTGKPLTVKLPSAVAAVHVLKQMGGMGGGMGGMGGGGMGGGGGGQGMGGGGGGMGGMGGGGMGGMGMMSIPPEKIVQIPIRAVCLDHGKPEPTPKMTYMVVPLETRVTDPALQEVVKLLATTNISQRAAQAATWHLSDQLTWQDLTNKTLDKERDPTPYFSPSELREGQEILSAARGRAAERKDDPAPQNLRVRKRRGKPADADGTKPAAVEADKKPEAKSTETTALDSKTATPAQ